MTVVMPPQIEIKHRFRGIFRVLAYMTYGGAFSFTLASSLLMITSAAVAALAGLALNISEALRRRALSLLSRGSPLSALAYRAREAYYERRRQGLAMD